ncbi:hypothetical protein EI982_17680 [Haloplanus rallus]|jgi:hypothetical protein|uniref:Uncharacterized protein n=1 Tax=Haloplanus rallus TaxID=1816183 RepID=A0A6B9F7Q7_9EURY|nr:hypothetical protein EI982_17680 [Haloplanus rallus]
MTLRIITHRCDRCGTIVGGNVLERNRTLKCPGLNCSRVHEFRELPADDREYLTSQTETYSIE